MNTRLAKVKRGQSLRMNRKYDSYYLRVSKKEQEQTLNRKDWIRNPGSSNSKLFFKPLKEDFQIQSFHEKKSILLELTRILEANSIYCS